MLPFTREQFLTVFVGYNEAVWPVELAAALRDSPPNTTASTTRLRRSSESAIPAASFPRRESSI